MRNLKPAIDIIKRWEGLRLHAYQDSVGVWTIGWGTTMYPSGVKVSPGDACSQSQAESYLSNDLVKIRIPVLDKYLKCDLNDNQYGAILCFVYNIGIGKVGGKGGFVNSSVLKKLNANDFKGAMDSLLQYNKAGGVTLTGLKNRRADEKKLFETPVVPSLASKISGAIGSAIDVALQNLPLPSNSMDKLFVEQQTLSKSGPQISREKCVQILNANKVDTTKPCLLGIRGFYLDEGIKGKNDRGIYDDALIWILPNGGIAAFRGNCDPSKYRKGRGVGAEKGMAHLKPGVWDYKPGIHKTYPAFVQAGQVTVIRDGLDKDYEDTGWFGVNIHHGSINGTSSLGCQTIMPVDWDAFKTLGYSELKKANMQSFKYCLVEQEQLNAGKLIA